MKKTIYLAICMFTLTCFNVSAQKQDPVIDQDEPLKAQVFLDDVVIQGSECVGFDCVNGESFGFDTERLKENNLRIHFDDTSSSASFPSNDWRIAINETSNGGASFFRIEDATAGTNPLTVRAGAGNNALYISNSGGNVGLGTAAPVVELHVTDGDSPTMRLEQNGASGFTPQTWDIAGNETNFFVRDVTNGSKLPFKIRPGAPTNSLYVNTNGNIGLGTASPTNKLHVENGDNDFVVSAAGNIGLGTIVPDRNLHIVTTGTNRNQILLETPNGAVQLRLQTDDQNRRIVALNASSVIQSQMALLNNGNIDFYSNTSAVFSRITTGSTSLTASSSRNLKSNIKNLEVPNILKRISSVPVTSYNWKSDIVNKEIASKNVVGLIAQDFYTVLNTGKDTEINGQDVQMALWMGVQALYKENTDIKTELEEKENRITELESKMDLILSKLESISINEDLNGLPNQSSLSQNIPNPFSKNTSISYDIPMESQSAFVQITNMKGQVIKTIPIKNFGIGVLNLAAEDMPAGSYAYSLVVNGTSKDTKQMIHVK